MELNLKDKVVIITGGAGTIGSSAARAFIAEGAFVALADINLQAGEMIASQLEAAAPGRTSFFHFDLRKEDTIRKLVGDVILKFGGIDIIVNNAATFSFSPLEKWTSTEALDENYAVSIRGATVLIQNAWRISPRSKSGSIVNISSVAGHVGEPNAFAYTPIKAAIKGLTLSCSIDMAKVGGWAVTLSPGHTWSTPHQKRASEENLTREQYENSKPNIQSTMFGRFLEPADVAAWIVLLASPLGRALTGQDIHATYGIEAGGFNRAYKTGIE